LLHTNASTIVMLCFTSTHNYIVCTMYQSKILQMNISPLSPTTILSVKIYIPIKDLAYGHRELEDKSMEVYYSCCGKSICGGCIHSLNMNWKPEKNETCLFCNTEILVKSDAEKIGYMMRRVNSNDAGAMHALGTCYYNGELGLWFAAGSVKGT